MPGKVGHALPDCGHVGVGRVAAASDVAQGDLFFGFLGGLRRRRRRVCSSSNTRLRRRVCSSSSMMYTSRRSGCGLALVLVGVALLGAGAVAVEVEVEVGVFCLELGVDLLDGALQVENYAVTSRVLNLPGEVADCVVAQNGVV